MSDDKKSLFEMPDYIQNLVKKIESVEIPSVNYDIPNRFDFSGINVELPDFTLDYDCELVGECPSSNEECYSGAVQVGYHNIRCSKAEKAQIAINLLNTKKTQSLNVVGNNNQVNQLGDNANTEIHQNQFIDSLPEDFLEEFRLLLNNPINQNKDNWIKTLERFISLGGSIASLVQLITMLV